MLTNSIFCNTARLQLFTLGNFIFFTSSGKFIFIQEKWQSGNILLMNWLIKPQEASESQLAEVYCIYVMVNFSNKYHDEGNIDLFSKGAGLR